MRKNTLFMEQFDLYTAVLNHILNPQEQTIVVDARGGRGKTHTMNEVVSTLSKLGVSGSVVAFTGRAAAQLRKTGSDANTIHSLIYKAVIDPETGDLIRFEPKTTQEIIADAGRFVIVDEGSMIPSESMNLISSLGIPVVVCGDVGQLPPVDKNNPDFNAMLSLPGSRYTLAINRRVDNESMGIDEMCTYVREHGVIQRTRVSGYSTISKVKLKSVDYHRENRFDVVLCGTNKTRKSMNQLIRAGRGFSGDIPEVGETVICKRNDVVGGTKINNGELFRVEMVVRGDPFSVFTLSNPDNGVKVAVRVYNSTWDTEEYPKTHNFKSKKTIQLFTFGYCISVHSSQGSTFDSVLFYDEDVSYFLEPVRFRYTGMSRAAKKLVVAL
jgi:exodeoxyribonuclease-5